MSVTPTALTRPERSKRCPLSAVGYGFNYCLTFDTLPESIFAARDATFVIIMLTPLYEIIFIQMQNVGDYLLANSLIYTFNRIQTTVLLEVYVYLIIEATITGQLVQLLRHCYRFGRSSNPESIKSHTISPTARHRCNVSSELCCPSAYSVAAAGDGPRHSLHASASAYYHEYNEDLI